LAVGKLGICGILTLDTDRSGALGIWRLTLGRLLAMLLWRGNTESMEDRKATTKVTKAMEMGLYRTML